MAALPRSDLLPAGYRLPEQRLAQRPPLQYSSRPMLYKISPPVLQLGNLPSEVEVVATWHKLFACCGMLRSKNVFTQIGKVARYSHVALGVPQRQGHGRPIKASGRTSPGSVQVPGSRVRRFRRDKPVCRTGDHGRAYEICSDCCSEALHTARCHLGLYTAPWMSSAAQLCCRSAEVCLLVTGGTAKEADRASVLNLVSLALKRMPSMFLKEGCAAAKQMLLLVVSICPAISPGYCLIT